jgi:hypothetical protein
VIEIKDLCHDDVIFRNFNSITYYRHDRVIILFYFSVNCVLECMCSVLPPHHGQNATILIYLVNSLVCFLANQIIKVTRKKDVESLSMNGIHRVGWRVVVSCTVVQLFIFG